MCISLALMGVSMYLLDGGRVLICYLSMIALFETVMQCVRRNQNSDRQVRFRRTDIIFPVLLFVVAIVLADIVSAIL